MFIFMFMALLLWLCMYVNFIFVLCILQDCMSILVVFGFQLSYLL